MNAEKRTILGQKYNQVLKNVSIDVTKNIPKGISKVSIDGEKKRS